MTRTSLPRPHADAPGEAGPRSTRDGPASFEASLREAPQDEDWEGTRPPGKRTRRRAWLSLGSNLGDRGGLIGQAVAALRATSGIAVERVSALYETPPWGDTDQGPFLNAAAAICTTLSPHALLDAVQAIEAALGRTRTRRWGPRTIDIDLVHVEGVALADERLSLPHPLWRERAFVLVPLTEIAPDLVIGGRAVWDTLREIGQAGVERHQP